MSGTRFRKRQVPGKLHAVVQYTRDFDVATAQLPEQNEVPRSRHLVLT